MFRLNLYSRAFHVITKHLLISCLQCVHAQLHKNPYKLPPEVRNHVLATRYQMTVLVSVPGSVLLLRLRNFKSHHLNVSVIDICNIHIQ